MHIIYNDKEPNPDPIELKQFFISHLNRLYCAKNQLYDKLPIIEKNCHSPDISHAVNETADLVLIQIGRLEEIYARLNTSYTPESCIGLLGFLDETFQSIGPPLDRPLLRDLSILFYMQNIESIEMASFEVMVHVADKLQEWDVARLLQECYDEARQSRTLYHGITGHYL